MGLEQVLSCLHDVRRTGTEWKARCPSCGSRKLAVGVGRTGKVVVWCSKGCPREAIRRSLGLSWAAFR
jgi:hypothetical protein